VRSPTKLSKTKPSKHIALCKCLWQGNCKCICCILLVNISVCNPH
jgi:hypothetical protein